MRIPEPIVNPIQDQPIPDLVEPGELIGRDRRSAGSQAAHSLHSSCMCAASLYKHTPELVQSPVLAPALAAGPVQAACFKSAQITGGRACEDWACVPLHGLLRPWEHNASSLACP